MPLKKTTLRVGETDAILSQFPFHVGDIFGV